MDEPTYEIPEGARVGDIPIPAGRMTAREVADHINASGEASARVLTIGDRQFLQVGGAPTSETTRAIAEHMRKLTEGGEYHRIQLGRRTPTPQELRGRLAAGLTPSHTRRRLGEADPTEDKPTARQHHHPGCRWSAGKKGSRRGWRCHANCIIPDLIAAEAADDE